MNSPTSAAPADLLKFAVGSNILDLNSVSAAAAVVVAVTILISKATTNPFGQLPCGDQAAEYDPNDQSDGHLNFPHNQGWLMRSID